MDGILLPNRTQKSGKQQMLSKTTANHRSSQYAMVRDDNPHGGIGGLVQPPTLLPD